MSFTKKLTIWLTWELEREMEPTGSEVEGIRGQMQMYPQWENCGK